MRDLLDVALKPRIFATINGVELKDAAREPCGSVEEVMELLKRGNTNRHVAETKMNVNSSRSHSIFIMQLDTETLDGTIVKQRTSHLNLVDLAGSERAGQTKAEGDRLTVNFSKATWLVYAQKENVRFLGSKTYK